MPSLQRPVFFPDAPLGLYPLCCQLPSERDPFTTPWQSAKVKQLGMDVPLPFGLTFRANAETGVVGTRGNVQFTTLPEIQATTAPNAILRYKLF